eukprot:854235-Rhodomonas_salina.1
MIQRLSPGTTLELSTATASLLVAGAFESDSSSSLSMTSRNGLPGPVGFHPGCVDRPPIQVRVRRLRLSHGRSTSNLARPRPIEPCLPTRVPTGTR